MFTETLRLYPPWLLLTKQCTQDTVLKSGDRTYPLTKGMSVAVPVYSISRDPQYFREPTEFDPSRFYETPLPPSFFPFGIGPRACLGEFKFNYSFQRANFSFKTFLNWLYFYIKFYF